MIPREIWRLCFIIRTFLHYRIDECLPKKRTVRFFTIWKFLFFWIKKEKKNHCLGKRLRYALQTLGPVWIKFGQMLSTRQDIVPETISKELKLLQNRVDPFSGFQAKKIIEREIGSPVEKYFDNFSLQPLAAASIAQVHTAYLKEKKKQVVIKVIRPTSSAIIASDIKLIYKIVKYAEYLVPQISSWRLLHIVKEYDRTLHNELDLLKEAANTSQIRRNFTNSKMLYVPKIFYKYCTSNVLVVERIYGIPISQFKSLEKDKNIRKNLAEYGVKIFFTQVFRDRLFHADMHPGNIFIGTNHSNTLKYIGVDYGIVGFLSKNDQLYLAENFLAFFNRNYRKIAKLHIQAGWVSSETNLEDFEYVIRSLCEPIFEKPLCEISFAHVLINFFKAGQKFNMQIQPQLVLLQKTLFYIEGLGRHLYPQLDLWNTAKPFLEKWIRKTVSINSLACKFRKNRHLWMSKIPEIPNMLHDNIISNIEIKNHIKNIAVDISKKSTLSKKKKILFSVISVFLLQHILGVKISDIQNFSEALFDTILVYLLL